MKKWICTVSLGRVVVEADTESEAKRLAAIKVRPDYENKPWLWNLVDARLATPAEMESYARLVDATKPREGEVKVGKKPRKKTRERLF